jgi:hypothetical protein
VFRGGDFDRRRDRIKQVAVSVERLVYAIDQPHRRRGRAGALMLPNLSRDSKNHLAIIG